MTTGTTAEADFSDLVRPIVGIENRAPQEAFDIMCDRIKGAKLLRRIAELEKALQPFADAARDASIAGRPPFEFCAASDYERAAALIHGGGHGR